VASLAPSPGTVDAISVRMKRRLWPHANSNVPRVLARVAAAIEGWWSRRISRPRASCPFQDNAIVVEYVNASTRALSRPLGLFSWKPLSLAGDYFSGSNNNLICESDFVDRACSRYNRCVFYNVNHEYRTFNRKILI